MDDCKHEYWEVTTSQTPQFFDWRCKDCRKNVGELVAQLTAERERSKRLREALEKAIQGYRNLIEVGALPHDGWDDETEKLIIHFRAALAADEADSFQHPDGCALDGCACHE